MKKSNKAPATKVVKKASIGQNAILAFDREEMEAAEMISQDVGGITGMGEGTKGEFLDFEVGRRTRVITKTAIEGMASQKVCNAYVVSGKGFASRTFPFSKANDPLDLFALERAINAVVE